MSSLPESPESSPRPSFQSYNGRDKASRISGRLVRRPSKLQTTVEVTRCRFSSSSRQTVRSGFEEFVPQKDSAPIFQAVYHDREAALRHFLDLGESPNTLDVSGMPLLCVAAAYGHFEIASILLEAGANVNSASQDKSESALHIAIRSRHLDIVDLLLVHRVDLEVRTTHTGQTALHYAAAASNSSELVVQLLKFGARYCIRDLKGQTPAATALQTHNFHAALTIINMARGDPRQLAKEKLLLLQHATQQDRRASVTNNLIAEIFAATCDPDSTVLVEAIKKNDVELVEVFLREGSDPNEATAKGLLPVVVAIKFADLRIIRLLVQYGADVTVKGPGSLDALQVLFKTITTRDQDTLLNIVQYLLAKGADVTALYADGKTLLHRVVNTNMDFVQVAQLLIKEGADTGAQDKDGNTALHLAAANGLVDSTMALLKVRVDSTRVDSQKRTALLRAILSQQWTVVPLLAVPPAITSWDAEGSTPLHHIARCIPRDQSCWKDIAASVTPFCERTFCRTMRDRTGATPLILAIRSLPEDGILVVESLLSKGEKKWSCIGHEDHNGHDALFYAATMAKPVFVDALLKHGAPLVLKDWTDDGKLAELSTDSRDKILELIIESDCSRRTKKAQTQHDAISELPTQPPARASSAMSGYHADCEGELKPRSAYRQLRKATSMQQLGVTSKQRTPSSTSMSRSSSTHHQSREPLVHHRKPMDQNEKAQQSISQRISPVTKTVHFAHSTDHYTKFVDTEHQERGPQGSAMTFPPRSSSMRDPIALSGALTPPPKEAKHMYKTASPKELTEAIPPTSKAPWVVEKLYVHAERKRVLAPLNTLAEAPTLGVVAEQTEPALEPTLSSAPPSSATPTDLAANLEPNTKHKRPALITNHSAANKPVQPARIDSAVSLERSDCKAVTSPTLDQSKPAPDRPTQKAKRQSGDELAGWLAISKMIDRL